MVVSGGSTSPRLRGVENRFYCPPQRRQLRAAAAAGKEVPEKEKRKDGGDGVLGFPQKAVSEEEIVEERRGGVVEESSNLERFLASTSLAVPAQFVPRTSMRRRRDSGIDNAPTSYYNLTDLWDSFKEWSAYGAGVPLVLNGTDSVVQYYVPFLSALQLFVGKPDSSTSSRRQVGEDSDDNSCQEETSSGSENEGPIPVRREQTENVPTTCTPYVDAEADDGFSSDGSDNSSSHCQLPVFQYFEHEPPYARQPLADKIWTLATKFLELKMYRSCDLLPASWISVAWYPIYRIPMGPTLQDLDACFLTFHSLSTVLKTDGITHQDINFSSASLVQRNCSDIHDKLSLPLLGLASYKFKESIWTSNKPSERELATNLMQSADDWLCRRKVNHPDYRFFLSHYNTAPS